MITIKGKHTLRNSSIWLKNIVHGKIVCCRWEIVCWSRKIVCWCRKIVCWYRKVCWCRKVVCCCRKWVHTERFFNQRIWKLVDVVSLVVSWSRYHWTKSRIRSRKRSWSMFSMIPLQRFLFLKHSANRSISLSEDYLKIIRKH